MIEFLIELLFSGLFEMFAEIVGWIGRRRSKGDEPTSQPTELDPWNPAIQQSRNVVTAKLMVGAAGGVAWGYYVATSSEVTWPMTFWSFAAIGAVAFALRLAGVSNEKATQSIDSRLIRGLVTFTPQRFGNWAALSLVTALAIGAGFLIGS